MRKLNSFFFIFIIALLISCSDDTPTEPIDNPEFTDQLTKLFPYNNDMKYKFRIDTLDQSSKLFQYVGNSVFTAVNKEIIHNQEYYSRSQLYSSHEWEHSFTA